jgi:hypothetical protein
MDDSHPTEAGMNASARIVSGIAACLLASAAQASFHFMQIEQVQGGVTGDVAQQAVQLRMRAGGQNQMQFSRLRVSDAAGANPVLLVDFTTTVPNATLGDRVLIASAGWAAEQAPVPDFTLANLIPTAYFAGGRLTFEDDGGGVVYSLCWGNYAGPNTGSQDNDADGQYGPCFAGPLPSSGLAALRFQGTANALGTTNAADYSLTAGAPTYTNNARVGAVLVAPPLAVRGGDCNDADASISPGQTEVAANAHDDDCDGLGDEDALNNPSPDTNDTDGDGIALQQGDCDDGDSAVHAGVPEIVGDRKDNDCDTRADEDATDVHSADGQDHDADGYGMFARVFTDTFED